MKIASVDKNTIIINIGSAFNDIAYASVDIIDAEPYDCKSKC